MAKGAALTCGCSCALCLQAQGQPPVAAEPSVLARPAQDWPVLTAIQHRQDRVRPAKKWCLDDHLPVQLMGALSFTPAETLLQAYSVVFTFAWNMSKMVPGTCCLAWCHLWDLDTPGNAINVVWKTAGQYRVFLLCHKEHGKPNCSIKSITAALDSCW